MSQTTKTSTVASSTLLEKRRSPPRKFVAKPFEYHQEVDLRIESLTNMGWGVGRLDIENDDDDNEISRNNGSKQNPEQVSSNEDDGTQSSSRPWVVMVPHVVVGELVKVRIFRNQRNYSEADLIEVLQASPNRVQPKCPLAGTCGGCQYQHMTIGAQRTWKTKHVEEVLLQQKIVNYDDSEKLQVLPTVGTEEVYAYRSKITPHYEAPLVTTVLAPDGVNNVTTYEMEAIGFQQSSNRQLVDVPHCPIALPALNDKYKEIRERLLEQAPTGALNQRRKKKKKFRRGNRGGALGATLLFRQADDDENGNPVVITDNNEYMTTTVKGIQFNYIAGNFFQNNNYVLPLMVDAVIEAATRPIPSSTTTTESKKPKYLIDCYCGSGLFALSASSHFDCCVGIELNQKAIEEATANAEHNSILNCQFVAASAEAIFQSPMKLHIAGREKEEMNVQALPRSDTVVVVDPPRKGCSEEFLRQLYEYCPQRIVYMSCGPATQARDAKGIVEIGGYDITSILPFDLFPQTKHIESLMVFEKKKCEKPA